jgi:hypothetical protein
MVVGGGRSWAEQAVNECFTTKEIRQLRRYLWRRYRLKLVVEPVAPPIDGMPYAEGDWAPSSALPDDSDELMVCTRTRSIASCPRYMACPQRGWPIPTWVGGVSS